MNFIDTAVMLADKYAFVSVLICVLCFSQYFLLNKKSLVVLCLSAALLAVGIIPTILAITARLFFLNYPIVAVVILTMLGFFLGLGIIAINLVKSNSRMSVYSVLAIIVVSCYYVFAIQLTPNLSTLLADKADLSTRISNVSAELKAVSAELSDIQAALEERIAFVEQLQGKAEQVEALASLYQDQVDAIADMLTGQSTGQNTLYLIIGVVATVAVGAASIVVPVYMAKRTAKKPEGQHGRTLDED